MKFRLIESIFVFALVGVVVSYFHQNPSLANQPVASASPAATITPRLLSLGEVVPQFSLSDPAGKELAYQAGQGPLLIVLTATGCQGCLERIDQTDRRAYEKAKSLDIPVWNMLVYQGVDGAASFVEQHKPSANRILCDASAAISVTTLGGSDETCWILIDKAGKLAWRGPAQIEGLEKALATL